MTVMNKLRLYDFLLHRANDVNVNFEGVLNHLKQSLLTWFTPTLSPYESK